MLKLKDALLEKKYERRRSRMRRWEKLRKEETSILQKSQQSCRHLDFAEANPATLPSVLRWCTANKLLPDGRLAHIHLVCTGFPHSAFYGNLLLSLYCNCDSLHDAHAVFARMHDKDQLSWKLLIKAYGRHDSGYRAAHIFHQMQLEGTIPDKFVVSTLFSVCDCHAELQRILACTVGRDIASDLILCNGLLSMHSRHQHMEDAVMIFDHMSERDVVSWNIIIQAFAHAGQGTLGLQHFEHMQNQAVLPDKATFVAVIFACTRQSALKQGRNAHALIMSTIFKSDASLFTSLVNMYGSCGSLVDAQGSFETARSGRYITSWNAMIVAYLHHGRIHDAICLFEQMSTSIILPSRATFVTILSACASQAAVDEGKFMHAHVIDNVMEGDVIVGNVLVSMYSKCGNLEDADYVFRKMPERENVTWNTMITAFVGHGQGHTALKLFHQMQVEGVMPNEVTFLNLLSACTTLAAKLEGVLLHVHIVNSNFVHDSAMRNTLLNMYGKWGSVEEAQKAFEKLVEPDVFSWNTLIAAYRQLGKYIKVVELFCQMQSEAVIPDKVTFGSVLAAFVSHTTLAEAKRVHASIAPTEWGFDITMGTTLINMYSNCKSVGDSIDHFYELPYRNTFTWNAIITAYAEHGQSLNAGQMFDRMKQEAVMHDDITFVCILSAYAESAAIADGKRIHAQIVCTEFEQDTVLGNAILSMYGKCGSKGDACRFFDNMPVKDEVSWSALISVYAQNGQAKDCLRLFGQMRQEGVVPTHITFLSVLSACRHAGLLKEGRECFRLMNQYGITPTVDHNNCMIDLFARAGLLNEAEDWIKRMPMNPTAASWTTLLIACRNLGDSERGERFAKQAMRLDPKNAAVYITLFNLYMAVGKEEDGRKVMDLMKGKSTVKKPACTAV